MSRLIGLHERVSTSVEILLGRDVAPQVGQRVFIASRYANDVWARDESGGRHGSVVKLMEMDNSHPENGEKMHGKCMVQWDTAQGKSWPDGPGSKVSAWYTGQYLCGANGHHQLALDPRWQPSDKEIGIRKIRARNKGTQSESAEHTALQPRLDAAGLARQHQDISGALEQVGALVKDEMEKVLDTCDDWISEAELALVLDGSERQINDQSSDRSAMSNGQGNGSELSEEERMLGKEIDDIWKVLSRAEIAFKRKVEADEAADRAMTALKEFVFPVFVTFCIAEIPELARGLERIQESGTQDLRTAGGIGKKYNVGGYQTPAALLVYDPDAEPDEQEANLDEFRNALKEVTEEMHTWKLRTGLPPGEESKPIFGTNPKRQELDAAKRPLLIDKFMAAEGDAPVEELAGKLEELGQRPEAALVKNEMDQVAGTLRSAAEAFGGLAKWAQEATGPENQGAEQVKRLRGERDGAIERIMEAFGKKEGAQSKEGDETKGAAKGTVEKAAGEGGVRLGPEYDPEDTLGAVAMGTELEAEQRKVRETVQRILLRLREVQRRKEKQAQQLLPRTAEKAAATEEGGRELVMRHLQSAHRGLVEGAGKSKGAGRGGKELAIPGVRERSMYDGLLKVYEAEEEGEEGGLELVAGGDLVRARRAVNEGGRLLRRSDVRRVRRAMEALGCEDGGVSAWCGERAAGLEERVARVEGQLAHAEDATMERAREAATRAELMLLGPMRGEVVGDAGQAAAGLEAARQAMETAAEAIELREAEALEREREDATRQHQVSVEAVRRLLQEGEALLADAQAMLGQEAPAPLEALLAFKSAEEKCRRANLSAVRGQRTTA